MDTAWGKRAKDTGMGEGRSNRVAEGKRRRRFANWEKAEGVS